ncbi:hypothetical protein BKI52_31145 [marine bacterium AO1-C]|nr:hypothetical protein BKI52_31145 [marine bacterium AO1-C]
MKILHKLLTFKILFILTILVVFLNACGGGGAAKSGDIFIPKNASIAAVIDLKQISSKAEQWRDVFKPEFLEQFDINIDEEGVENTIKLVQKIIPTLSQDSKISIFNGEVAKDRSKNHFVIAFTIANVSEFEKALQSDKGIKIVSENGEKHAFLDEKAILNWKGNSGLYVGYEFKIENPQQALKAKVKEIRGTTAADALEKSNKEFKALLGEKHDVAIWANQKETRSLTPSIDMYSKMSPTIAKLAEANQYGTSFIDFEPGKLVINGRAFLDEKLTAKYKPILNVNADKVIKNLPIKNPLLLLSLSINMQDIKKILDEENAYDKFDGGAIATLQGVGLTPQDIAEMLSGDVVVALENIKINGLQSVDARVVVGLGLNNREVFEKALKPYVDQKLLFKEGNVYEPIIAPLGINIKLIVTDEAAFIVTTESFKDAITSSKKTLLNSDLKNMAGKSNFMMFLSPNEIYSNVPEGTLGQDELLGALFPLVESVTLNTLPAKNELLEGNIIVNFKDKKKNALAQLLGAYQQKPAN